MSFSITRWDGENVDTVGYKKQPVPTWGNPIVRSGNQLLRDGVRFRVNGHGAHAQNFGTIYATCTRAEIDQWAEGLRKSRINAVSVMQMEGNIVNSGARRRKPYGMWDNGQTYLSNTSWNPGDVCMTLDTSGFTRVYRKYQTAAGGASSGGATAGPTHASGTVTFAGVSWTYIGQGYQDYNEVFFTGDDEVCGFDYFMDACGRNGIYVYLRFDQWRSVFMKLNNGYLLNGSANGAATTLDALRFCWPLNGSGGTVNLMQGNFNHIDQFLTRQNSVNGKWYYEDHTLHAIDLLNEQGMANAYFIGGSDRSWDQLCRVGSTNDNSTEPNAAIVRWWDADWLAWFQARNGGLSPSQVYTSPARMDTLPTYSYDATAGGGPNVAPRNMFRSGTLAEGWNLQVATYLQERELAFCNAHKAFIKAKAPHVLVNYGQNAWVFSSTIAESELADCHLYVNDAFNTVSNTGTNAIPTGGSNGITWVAGTLLVVKGSAFARTPLVGMKHRITCGAYTAVLPVAAVSTTTVANDTISFTGVPDPGAGIVDGTKRAGTVITPTADVNTWSFHNNVNPVDNANTIMYFYDADTPGVESYYVRARGWVGNTGYGSYYPMIDSYRDGIPTVCSERGERGIAGPFKGLYNLAYTLIDCLQDGSGGYQFTWNNYIITPQVGEHGIPGEGTSFLDAEIMAQMQEYITPFTQEDVTSVTIADMAAEWAKSNTTDTARTTVNGFSTGYYVWSPINHYWQALTQKRVKLAIAPSVSNITTAAYSMVNTGFRHAVLNDEMNGLLYIWLDFGTVIYSNGKILQVFGRIPKSSDDLKLAGVVTPDLLTRLKWKTVDGYAWYGLISLSSVNGGNLGVGDDSKIAVHTRMFPRAEANAMRRFLVDATPLGRVECLDGDNPGSNVGAVLRNGLELQIQTDRAHNGYRHARGTVKRVVKSSAWTGGYMKFAPNAPRIILSAA